MHKKSSHRLLLLFAVLPVFLCLQPALAQLAPFNDKGVTIGHVHWVVKDPEVHKKLLIDTLNAQVAHAGPLEMLKLPGVIILLTRGTPKEGPDQPTTDHFALVVRDLAATAGKLAAANIPVSKDPFVATFPEGLRVEFIEDRSLTVPVAFHHFHLRTGGADETLEWYTKHFGINFPPGNGFPGGKVYVSAPSGPPRAPSLGYAFDHIGFEVKNLTEFCGNLEAQGIKLDLGIIDAPQIGLKVAFITDPVGTRIELTEGLTGE
jgi:catechol 2,3-dioxygenase-like lactoylglutathione lyase family enzyme